MWEIFCLSSLSILKNVASHSKVLQLIPHGILNSCNHFQVCKHTHSYLQKALPKQHTWTPSGFQNNHGCTNSSPFSFQVHYSNIIPKPHLRDWYDLDLVSERRTQGHIQGFPLIRASEGLHSKHPCPAETEPGWTLIGSVFRFNELWVSGPPTHTIHGQTCVKGQPGTVVMGLVRALGSECTCWRNIM